MKKSPLKLFILIINFIFLLHSCGNTTENKKEDSLEIRTNVKDIKSLTTSKLIIPDSLNQKFKVLKIDSIDNSYMTYAFKADKYYKILSKKSDLIKSKWKKIELGSYYNLQLKENYSQRGIYEHAAGIAAGDGPIIYFEGDSIRSLYSSPNIRGLYYSPSL